MSELVVPARFTPDVWQTLVDASEEVALGGEGLRQGPFFERVVIVANERLAPLSKTVSIDDLDGATRQDLLAISGFLVGAPPELSDLSDMDGFDDFDVASGPELEF
jgi:hypothetical protein